MPTRIRADLVEATRKTLEAIDIEGIAAPAIREGTVGAHARAIGAASLPLSSAIWRFARHFGGGQ